VAPVILLQALESWAGLGLRGIYVGIVAIAWGGAVAIVIMLWHRLPRAGVTVSQARDDAAAVPAAGSRPS
jgi:hypothetical protein